MQLRGENVKFSSVIKVLFAVAIMSLAMFAVVGCGSGDDPEDVVKAFIEAGQDKDCEEMVSYMDLDIDEAMMEELGIESADFEDQIIEACEADADTGGDITDYEIGETTIDGDTATVEVSVTTEVDGETMTDDSPLELVKVDDEWMISLGL
jgi:hypothetical protein